MSQHFYPHTYPKNNNKPTIINHVAIIPMNTNLSKHLKNNRIRVY